MFRTGRSVRDWVGGILACLLCIGLLMSLTILDSGGTKSTRPPVAAANAAAAAAVTMSSLGRKHLDPFMSSKRRVPNGPDPIHNRRAGKSGRPPGRA